jgi:hypothetical protein
MSTEEKPRSLTDADIEALAKALKDEFYTNLGRGVWALVWKVLVTAAVGVAAYGTLKGLTIR